ncbi:MAG: class GN sortase [Nitrospira sp.]|nr:class GN sortase [Nitrospira sp.]
MNAKRGLSLMLTMLAIGALGVGMWQLWEGSWIYMKAGLAQYLLKQAWFRTVAEGHFTKPWPWADTWPVARLMLPSRHIDLIVLQGAYGRTLAFGPGFVESSTAPGLPGTTILTGHRDTHFAFLEHVQPGEYLSLQSPNGSRQSYRVRTRHIIDRRTGIIRLDQEHRALVLVTCYPFDSPISGGPLRYVVTAEADG